MLCHVLIQMPILGSIMMVALRLVCYNSFDHYPRWSQDSACYYILKFDDTVLDASGSTEISSC